MTAVVKNQGSKSSQGAKFTEPIRRTCCILHGTPVDMIGDSW